MLNRNRNKRLRSESVVMNKQLHYNEALSDEDILQESTRNEERISNKNNSKLLQITRSKPKI